MPSDSSAMSWSMCADTSTSAIEAAARARGAGVRRIRAVPAVLGRGPDRRCPLHDGHAGRQHPGCRPGRAPDPRIRPRRSPLPQPGKPSCADLAGAVQSSDGGVPVRRRGGLRLRRIRQFRGAQAFARRRPAPDLGRAGNRPGRIQHAAQHLGAARGTASWLRTGKTTASRCSTGKERGSTTGGAFFTR